MGLYQLLISGIVPRPVGFVSSISEDGVENLALFSWFNMVTHDPPTLSLCITSGKAGPKDTAANILATKEFTVNIISEAFVQGANATAIDAPREVSEWGLSGLTKEKSISVKPPRVKESAFSMECNLFHSLPIGSTTLILGRITHIHVRNDVLNERGLVDPAKLRPIARLGDITFARLGDLYRIPRPVWEKEREAVEKLG